VVAARIVIPRQLFALTFLIYRAGREKGAKATLENGPKKTEENL
jgi:hypothetical protein